MADQKIVYIIDDDPDIRNALEHLLSMHGYRSCLYASIAEFHSKAKALEAACLIVDIQLNGAGFELKRQLSNFDPGLPVIFITGSDTEENRLMAQQGGGGGVSGKAIRVEGAHLRVRVCRPRTHQSTRFGNR